MNLETKLIKSKLGLLGLAEELGNVSRAYKYLGYSRDTFYRYKELFEEGLYFYKLVCIFIGFKIFYINNFTTQPKDNILLIANRRFSKSFFKNNI